MNQVIISRQNFSSNYKLHVYCNVVNSHYRFSIKRLCVFVTNENPKLYDYRCYKIMDWPWQYSFPPFFTLQPHAPTREKQIQAWKYLVISYCQVNTLSTLDLAEAGDLPLFHNGDIDRRLSQDEIREICDELERSGNLEWTDKTHRRAHIFWKSPAQLGADIYKWVDQTGQAGTVLTVTEILEEGENGASWRGVSTEVVVKALLALQKEKKAELFEDREGAKFF